MTFTEIIIYFLLPLIVVAGILVLLKTKKPEKQKINHTQIIDLFQKDNTSKIELVRNKIVVTCLDYKQVDVAKLKEFGATGISIVSNKIKFYFKDDKVTTDLYNQLKHHLER